MKRVRKEFGEFGLVHFANTHHEIAVAVLSVATCMAGDRDVVWRIGEHHFRFPISQELFVAVTCECIAEEQPVLTEFPKITRLAYLHGGSFNNRISRVGLLGCGRREIFDEYVDLTHFEASGFQAEIDFRLGKDFQLLPEDLIIPLGVFR